MKFKMHTAGGDVIIDADKVGNFYPASNGIDTEIEIINDDGSTNNFTVNHDFCDVTRALAYSWGRKTGFIPAPSADKGGENA